MLNTLMDPVGSYHFRTYNYNKIGNLSSRILEYHLRAAVSKFVHSFDSCDELSDMPLLCKR